MKACNCKDQEMPASKEEGRSVRGKSRERNLPDGAGYRPGIAGRMAPLVRTALKDSRDLNCSCVGLDA